MKKAIDVISKIDMRLYAFFIINFPRKMIPGASIMPHQFLRPASRFMLCQFRWMNDVDKKLSGNQIRSPGFNHKRRELYALEYIYLTAKCSQI